MGYLTNFIVYMLAMVGVLAAAMLAFKFTTSSGKCSSGKCLKVLDTLSLGGRKTLYIVSAGDEKFLIAGDTDRTSLISKLNPKSDCGEKFSAIATSESDDYSTKSYKPASQKNYIDRASLGIYPAQNFSGNSVMRSMANKLSGSIYGGQADE